MFRLLIPRDRGVPRSPLADARGYGSASSSPLVGQQAHGHSLAVAARLRWLSLPQSVTVVAFTVVGCGGSVYAVGYIRCVYRGRLRVVRRRAVGYGRSVYRSRFRPFSFDLDISVF